MVLISLHSLLSHFQMKLCTDSLLCIDTDFFSNLETSQLFLAWNPFPDFPRNTSEMPSEIESNSKLEQLFMILLSGKSTYYKMDFWSLKL